MATSAYLVANLHCSELTNHRGQNLVSAQYAPLINQPISGYYEKVPETAQPMRCNFENSSDSSKLMTSPIDPQLKVDLHDKELWEKFSSAQTEMIVTKIGRRMFPGYRVKLSGLDPEAQYCVLMDVVNVDDHRYKFQNGEWSIAGRGEPQIPQRFYLHPTSPASGQQWMREIVSFHKVKLTNSCGNSADGKFLIHSMHRYQPRIHMVRTDDVSTLHLQPMSIFSFPQTSFITVTAYQNEKITKLKVDNNPFARGFRKDGGKVMNVKALASGLQNPIKASEKRRTKILSVNESVKRWKPERKTPPNTLCNVPSQASLVCGTQTPPYSHGTAEQFGEFQRVACSSYIPNDFSFQSSQNYSYVPNTAPCSASSAYFQPLVNSTTPEYEETASIYQTLSPQLVGEGLFVPPISHHVQSPDVTAHSNAFSFVSHSNPPVCPETLPTHNANNVAAFPEQIPSVDNSHISTVFPTYLYHQAQVFRSPLTSIDEGYFSTNNHEDDSRDSYETNNIYKY